MNNFKSNQLRMMLPYFLLAAAVIVLYKVINEVEVIVNFFKRAGYILAPFFYGFLIAYILAMPQSTVERWVGNIKAKFIPKIKRAVSISIVYIIAILFIYLTLGLVIPYLSKNVAAFVGNVPTYVERAEKYVDDINNALDAIDYLNFTVSLDALIERIQTFGEENFSLEDFSIEKLSAQFGAVKNASSALFRGFLAIISSVYFLFEREKLAAYLSKMFKAILPAHSYGGAAKYAVKLNENFKGYIYTQTIDGIILGTIATVELFFIGSPYFLFLGLMLGVVNYIPYFGSIFGSLVAIAVVFITQGSTYGLICAAILLVTQQIDGNIIQPKLMGSTFSLSPLLVIISITVGGAIAGILGMLAAIPIVAILKDALDDIIKYHETRKYYAQNERRRRSSDE